jgi:GTPase
VLELDGGVRVPRVFVSALTGQGLDALKQVISQAVDGSLAEQLDLNPSSTPSTDDEAGDDGLRPTGTQHSHP